MSTTTDKQWFEKIGENAFDSVAEMVAALEIKGAAETYAKDLSRADCAGLLEEAGIQVYDEEGAEELREAVAENIADGTIDPEDFEHDEDEARQRIEEDALSVEVGGWWSPGGEAEPTEYRLLLCTGGPAVRIVGELGQWNEPHSARLEVQDWFKPWTEYHCDEEILLTYAKCFYFGD